MIGGVFLLARDPSALAAWYERHLGWRLTRMDDGAWFTELRYRDADGRATAQRLVYAIMPGDPGPTGSGCIVNYRVDDLQAVLATLRDSGVETEPVVIGDDGDGDGSFVRLLDPEGHRIELWEHIGHRPAVVVKPPEA